MVKAAEVPKLVVDNGGCAISMILVSLLLMIVGPGVLAKDVNGGSTTSEAITMGTLLLLISLLLVITAVVNCNIEVDNFSPM